MTRYWSALSVLALSTVLCGATPAFAQLANGASQTPADDRAPSFLSLFTELPSDVRRLPTLSNALWLGGTGGLALAVEHRDHQIAAHAHGDTGLEEFLDPGEPLGGSVVQAGGAVATYLIGRFAHEPELGRLGADLVRAQIISGALTQAIKASVDRTRPDGGHLSFPSGHSSATFATAAVLQRHYGWMVGVPAYAVASYVATSRLSENKHFLSDVIFGAGVGIVSGRAVNVGTNRHTFAIAPTIAPGAYGVTFTRVGGRP
jgi:membrane-associated phospholipid phosphatase